MTKAPPANPFLRRRQLLYRLALSLGGFSLLAWLTWRASERPTAGQLLFFAGFAFLVHAFGFRIHVREAHDLTVDLGGAVHVAAALVGGPLLGAWVAALGAGGNWAYRRIREQAGAPWGKTRLFYDGLSVASVTGVYALAMLVSWAVFALVGGRPWAGQPLTAIQAGPLIVLLALYSVGTSAWVLPLYRFKEPPTPWRSLLVLEGRILAIEGVPQVVAGPSLAAALLSWPNWLAGILLLSVVLFVAVTRYAAALYEQALQRVRLEEELDAARRMQASFLPALLAPVVGWSLAARWEPANQVSGDFYDVIPLPSGDVGVVIADVSGKGAGAALLMAVARTYIRAAAATVGDDPAAVLEQVNRWLASEALEGSFVSACYVLLRPNSGLVRWANAGHPRPLLRRASGEVEVLFAPGMVMGVVPGARYETKEISFAPGDSLLLYTDGLTDAADRGLRHFGDRRLRSLIGAVSPEPHTLVSRISEATLAFRDGVAPGDDLTLVAMRYDGENTDLPVSVGGLRASGRPTEADRGTARSEDPRPAAN